MKKEDRKSKNNFKIILIGLLTIILTSIITQSILAIAENDCCSSYLSKTCGPDNSVYQCISSPNEPGAPCYTTTKLWWKLYQPCNEGICSNGACGTCTPLCAGRNCGSNGCPGGSCGTCSAGYTCNSNGVCTPNCVGNCNGRNCGPNSCGTGSCGTCSVGYTCNSNGVCTPNCVPNCNGRNCGPNTCNTGSCGTCSAGYTCSSNGVCTPNCVGNCNGRNCGPNTCNTGSCGTCSAGYTCSSNGVCTLNCVPNCNGRNCGPNTCNTGSCGTCSAGYTCSSNGVCTLNCVGNCNGRNCGSNGCPGGSCGTCSAGYTCSSSGVCVSTCQPQCTLAGQTQCKDGSTIQTCTNVNNCLVLVETVCSYGCLNNKCNSACPVNCNDGNQCTQDLCTSGSCANPPLQDYTPCTIGQVSSLSPISSFFRMFQATNTVSTIAGVCIASICTVNPDDECKGKFDGYSCGGKTIVGGYEVTRGICKGEKCKICGNSPVGTTGECIKCQTDTSGNPFWDLKYWQTRNCGGVTSIGGKSVYSGSCDNGICKKCTSITPPSGSTGECIKCQTDTSGNPFWDLVYWKNRACGNYISIGGKNVHDGACRDGICKKCPATIPAGTTGECLYCQTDVDGNAIWDLKYWKGRNCKTSSGDNGKCQDGICLSKDCNPQPNECQLCDKTDPLNPVVKPDSTKKDTPCKLSTDTGTTKSGSCDDKGVCQNSNCKPACSICQKCIKKTDGKYGCIKDSLKNGFDCQIINPLDGFCLEGDCKQKSCQGLDCPVTCGSAKSTGMKCCKSNEYCCDKGGSGTEVCCKGGSNPLNPIENPDEICKSMTVGLFKYISYCDPVPKKCSNQFKGGRPLYLCPTGGSAWSGCCDTGPGGTEVCLTTSAGGGMGYCGKKTCIDPQKPCGKLTGAGDYCCEPSNCVNDNTDYPSCRITQCTDKNQHYCPGGQIDGKPTGVCCINGIEACGTYPNGFARCLAIKNPKGDPVIDSQSSIFLVRDSNNFSLNGIAYVINPHVFFNSNYSFYINYSYFSGNNLNIFKFENETNVLDACSSQIISYITRTINSSGLDLKYGNEWDFNVPLGALDNATLFNITKYNLYNCYLPGSQTTNIPLLSECTNDADCDNTTSNDCTYQTCDSSFRRCLELNKADGTSCPLNYSLSSLSPMISILKFFGLSFPFVTTQGICQSGVCTNPVNQLKLKSYSAPYQANIGDKFQIKCNFGYSLLGCVQAYHGSQPCVYSGYSGSDSLWNCTANLGGDIKNYCNTFAYNGDTRVTCTNNINEIQTTSVTCVPSCVGKQCGSDGCSGSCGTCGSGSVCQNNGLCSMPLPVATLASYYAPLNANLGDKFQIKCNFGYPLLGCVQAYHGTTPCIYSGYVGSDSIWNCTALSIGTITNYCSTFAYTGDSRVICNGQTNPITSTSVINNPLALTLDTFDSINTNIWNQASSRNAIIENGKLKSVGAAGDLGNSDSGLVSRVKLHGDFDIQVDYDASIMPNTNGITNAAATNALILTGSTYSYYLMNSKGSNNGFTIVSWSNQAGWYKFQTGGAVGKFRITRSGNTITGYILSNVITINGGDNWTPFITASGGDTGDLTFIIKAYNNIAGSANGVVPQAYFDNFKVNSGTIV